MGRGLRHKRSPKSPVLRLLLPVHRLELPQIEIYGVSPAVPFFFFLTRGNALPHPCAGPVCNGAGSVGLAYSRSAIPTKTPLALLIAIWPGYGRSAIPTKTPLALLIAIWPGYGYALALLRDPAGDRPLSDPHVRPRELRVGRINQYPPTALAASTRPRPRGLQEGRINQYPSHIPRGPTPQHRPRGMQVGQDKPVPFLHPSRPHHPLRPRGMQGGQDKPVPFPHPPRPHHDRQHGGRQSSTSGASTGWGPG
ncbi:hypothetical protein RR46_09928 [Papilio xuthus]|uniref:Uncharacterized protein n=1 Tax=Papilio xuthus TaxID=66420 RepID=A0A194QCL6_PAPXU|nr:hypothetical protein RR46_09928 [Papilio xuthus]